MEEGPRRTKDRRFRIELRDRPMNIILLLYVKIKSKSSAFGIRGSSGEQRGFAVSRDCMSPQPQNFQNDVISNNLVNKSKIDIFQLKIIYLFKYLLPHDP